jgi:hypothetical protein
MTREQFKKPWYLLRDRTIQYAFSGDEKMEDLTGIPGMVGHLLFIGTVGLILLILASGMLGKY